MKQLTQSEIRKNGKVYKNVSSPATEGTMKQVTDIVEKDGTFSISTDGGKTYSPASGAIPEALPQEASALKSGNLPTSGWTTIGISTEAAYAYTISDTSITTNSDILMELTDDGGVKAYSMEAGKMTVIRDTVPTQPIPYTYKVKQTNASGQFTLVNHFTPSIPVTSVNGQTGAVTIAVPTKTSQLQNDSGFLTENNIVAGDNVTVTDENGNVKISATGGGSGGGGIGDWQNGTKDTELADGTYIISFTVYDIETASIINIINGECPPTIMYAETSLEETATGIFIAYLFKFTNKKVQPAHLADIRKYDSGIIDILNMISAEVTANYKYIKIK